MVQCVIPVHHKSDFRLLETRGVYYIQFKQITNPSILHTHDSCFVLYTFCLNISELTCQNMCKLVFAWVRKFQPVGFMCTA